MNTYMEVYGLLYRDDGTLLEKKSMHAQTKLELEAATFRRLLQHLDDNKQVQNIDLMNLAGFCRNCLSKWYRAAAEDKGIALDYAAAREIIYNMPYAEWKAKYQTKANPDQRAAFSQHSKYEEP